MLYQGKLFKYVPENDVVLSLEWHIIFINMNILLAINLLWSTYADSIEVYCLFLIYDSFYS